MPKTPWLSATTTISLLIGALGGGTGIRALEGPNPETSRRLDKIESTIQANSAVLHSVDLKLSSHLGEHRALERRLKKEE